MSVYSIRINNSECVGNFRWQGKFGALRSCAFGSSVCVSFAGAALLLLPSVVVEAHENEEDDEGADDGPEDPERDEEEEADDHDCGQDAA